MKSRRRRPRQPQVRNDDKSIAKMVTVYGYDEFCKHADEHPTWTTAWYLKKNIDLFLIILHSAFTSKGELKSSAKEVVEKCNTYVESAPPNGLRLYIRGRLPKDTPSSHDIGDGCRLEVIQEGFLGIPKKWITNTDAEETEPNALMDYLKNHKLFCFGQANEIDGFTSKAELEIESQSVS